jgi:hypothetical protein
LVEVGCAEFAAIVSDESDLELATIGEKLFAAALLNNGRTSTYPPDPTALCSA